MTFSEREALKPDIARMREEDIPYFFLPFLQFATRCAGIYR